MNRTAFLLCALGLALCIGCVMGEEKKELPYREGRPFQAARDRARALREANNDTMTEEKVGLPGVFGVDMAIWTVPSSSQWSCMRNQGNYAFAVIEGWNGGRGVNTNIGEVTKAAWNAGFQHVDIYSFMCPNCGNSASSVRDLVNTIKSQGARFGQVWLDVEQCSGCWNSAGENVQYLQGLVSEYRSLGVSIGIYTSSGEWSAVTGGSTAFSDLPLWYAHYDGNPSFSDWSPMYGWRTPAMKQFADSAGNTCGTSVDRDWYP